MATDTQVKILNNLISRCYDAEHGFKEAAEYTDSTHLSAIFKDYEKQRYDFGHELKKHIRSLGGEIEKGTSMIADVHRTWMDLKQTASANDDKAILEEVNRGEGYALNSYNKALEDIDPRSAAFETVTKQRNQIRSSIDRMQQLIPVYEDA